MSMADQAQPMYGYAQRLQHQIQVTGAALFLDRVGSPSYLITTGTPELWCHSSKHHHFCIAKIGKPILAHPSGKNDPISCTNKTVRQIFNWVKIGGFINLRSPWILLVGT